MSIGYVVGKRFHWCEFIVAEFEGRRLSVVL